MSLPTGARTIVARSRWRLFICFAASAVLLNAAAVKGAILTVFSGNDSGPGTLRQAIFDASSGDTIKFATGITMINLTSAELLINKNLTVDGPVAVQSSSNSSRVFHIAPASVTVTISGLTIRGGHPLSNEHGGGILNTGTLTINNSTISGNTTHYDGSSNGGGIANTGMLTIANSTISGNAIFFHTINSGGGIANFNGGTLIILNSTISGNGRTDNNCGGGIFTDGSSSTTARSTIIALNNGTSGPDICGPLTSQNFNLVGNNSGATITPQSSDQIGTPASPIDPLLGPLQFNGGSTFTQALQSNSPAVDHGDPNEVARDQRGYLRAGVSDVGAFEFAGTVPVSLANISTRLFAGTGNNVLIGGFILTGAQPKKVIVRAIGPSLPLAGVLTDPILELRNSSGGLIAVNDNWRTDQQAEIMATTIPPSNDLESAIVATLPANNSAYTAIVRGVNNGTGVGLVEV
jgi:hypothetical protein